jgi:hypothetical protein
MELFLWVQDLLPRRKNVHSPELIFFRGKVRLFPYLAERFNSTTRRKEKENGTDK